MPTESVSRLAAHSGIDVSTWRAYLYLEALDRRALGTLEPPLSTAQFHALVALDSAPGQSLGELATVLLCAKSNASGLVERLATLGLVERVQDASDGRRIKLTLSGAGEASLEQAHVVRRLALDHALGSTASDQLAAIAVAIEHLTTLLGQAVLDDDIEYATVDRAGNESRGSHHE